MKAFFEKLYEVVCRGESFVLVSVVSSSGSTPRGNGARMAVFSDGSIAGTIGGGAVEYLSIQTALEAMKEKKSQIKGFNLSRGQKADIGMICGGQVDVCFQYVEAGSEGGQENFKALLEDILDLYERNVDAWIITRIVDGVAVGMGIYDTEQGLRYLPREAYAKLRPYLKNKAILTSGSPSYFVDPLMRAGYTYVFGGGHVSQALVPVISNLEFKTVVYENRAEFANAALFPGAFRTILGNYIDLRKNISIGPADFVVIMTRGHQSDYEVLSQVLKTPAAYIGVIGSRTKMDITRQRLAEEGFTPQDLARIHSPIGLPIKAQTPAEIAISVAAELILCRTNYREEKDAQ